MSASMMRPPTDRALRWILLGLGLLALIEYLLWPGAHVKIIQAASPGTFRGTVHTCLAVMLVALGAATCLMAIPVLSLRARAVLLLSLAAVTVGLDQFLLVEWLYQFAVQRVFWTLTVLLSSGAMLLPILWGCAILLWSRPARRRIARFAGLGGGLLGAVILTAGVLQVVWIIQTHRGAIFPRVFEEWVVFILHWAMFLLKIVFAVNALRWLGRKGRTRIVAWHAFLIGSTIFFFELLHHLLLWTHTVPGHSSSLTLPYLLLGIGVGLVLLSSKPWLTDRSPYEASTGSLANRA
jgi:hypothetical protein